MTATISQLRDALAVRLSTIPGLSATAIMPAKPNVPAAAVALRTLAYDQEFDGGVKYSFYLWIYVNPAVLDRAQVALDAYLAPDGAYSVKAVVEADQSLGGLSSWVRVTGTAQSPSIENVAGSQALAIPLDCEIMAP